MVCAREQLLRLHGRADAAAAMQRIGADGLSEGTRTDLQEDAGRRHSDSSFKSGPDSPVLAGAVARASCYNDMHNVLLDIDGLAAGHAGQLDKLCVLLLLSILFVHFIPVFVRRLAAVCLALLVHCVFTSILQPRVDQQGLQNSQTHLQDDDDPRQDHPDSALELGDVQRIDVVSTWDDRLPLESVAEFHHRYAQYVIGLVRHFVGTDGIVPNETPLTCVSRLPFLAFTAILVTVVGFIYQIRDFCGSRVHPTATTLALFADVLCPLLRLGTRSARVVPRASIVANWLPSACRDIAPIAAT